LREKKKDLLWEVGVATGILTLFVAHVWASRPGLLAEFIVALSLSLLAQLVERRSPVGSERRDFVRFLRIVCWIFTAFIYVAAMWTSV
jgi:hypothetical protein